MTFDESKISNSISRSDFYQSDQQTSSRLTTGSKNIDLLLNGGLELGAITQFYGGPYTGKTHLCHLLCAVMPPASTVFYIDTEARFREEKVQSIARARRLQSDPHNIHIARPIDSKEQESCIDQLCYSMNLSTTKLIIRDLMMYHYKTEYPGRNNLSKRGDRLIIYMNKLRQLALTMKIAVVITNHSVSDPHSGSMSRPFGGNILSYASDYIINLKRYAMSGNLNVVLIKSSIKGYQSKQLIIEDFGFYDVGIK